MTRRLLQRALAGVLVAGLLAACGSEQPGAEAQSGGSEDERPGQSAQPVSAEPGHQHERKDRPLPAFGGRTLAGEPLEVSSLLGRRLLILFFNPEVPESGAVADAVSRVARERDEQNFRILGVAMAAPAQQAREFAEQHGLDFPILDDSSARIAGRLGLRTPVAVLGVDAEGFVTWGQAQFASGAPDAVKLIETQLRSSLRLPEPNRSSAPGDRPEAPLFEGKELEGGATFRLADQRGHAVLLVFFLHTCPHCHEFLEFVKPLIRDAPEKTRPRMVGVEITGKTFAVRESMRSSGLDYFPVIFDDDGSIREAYGVFAGVPDIVLIDAEGRIAHRSQGWQQETEGPLLRMRLAKLSGAPVPMLLRTTGYSGSEACGVCHEQQHLTWQLTQHASAYDTLVRHASDSDPECVSCHVVGFGQRGGFDLADRAPELEDVGCESCHGRGGPHLSPQFVQGGSYASACLQCHDAKHSLGFEYATFLPRISHAANARILALPADEREKILAERGAPRKDVLPTQGEHVGSEVCRSCHEAEYATWAAGPHAAALASLAREQKQSDPDCLRCHTTGFGRPGGFRADADPTIRDDLARVGCESCHGPGSRHVADGATRLGSIVSLGDKCDSCVILQICGGCHDDANDPGFEFEVVDKIEKIRHGTIEAGTGKPLPRSGKSAQAPPSASRPMAALLAEAFARAEGADGGT